MREQIHARIEVLRKELETGQAELEKVGRQRTYFRETMLRISGAIQVLEELLAEGESAGRNGASLETQLSPAQADEART